jgi:hypothetical protein
MLGHVTDEGCTVVICSFLQHDAMVHLEMLHILSWGHIQSMQGQSVSVPQRLGGGGVNSLSFSRSATTMMMMMMIVMRCRIQVRDEGKLESMIILSSFQHAEPSAAAVFSVNLSESIAVTGWKSVDGAQAEGVGQSLIAAKRSCGRADGHLRGPEAPW